MHRILFQASGFTYEYRQEKDLLWWQNRIEERGLKSRISVDGRDKTLIVDDRDDPIFEPKEKAHSYADATD